MTIEQLIPTLKHFGGPKPCGEAEPPVQSEGLAGAHATSTQAVGELASQGSDVNVEYIDRSNYFCELTGTDQIPFTD